MLLEALFSVLAAPSIAAYVSPRYAHAMKDALPRVAAPELRPTVEKLSDLDFSKVYARQVLSQAQVQMQEDTGIGPSAEFLALSPEKRAEALTLGIRSISQLFNEHAQKISELSKQEDKSAPQVVDATVNAEVILVYGHPYLWDEEHKNLKEAYRILRGFNEKLREQMDSLKFQVFQRALDPGYDDAQAEIEYIELRLKQDERKTIVPNPRWANFNHDVLHAYIARTQRYGATKGELFPSLIWSLRGAHALIDQVKERDDPDHPDRGEATRLVAEFGYILSEFQRHAGRDRALTPEQQAAAKAGAARALEFLRDLAE